MNSIQASKLRSPTMMSAKTSHQAVHVIYSKRRLHRSRQSFQVSHPMLKGLVSSLFKDAFDSPDRVGPFSNRQLEKRRRGASCSAKNLLVLTCHCIIRTRVLRRMIGRLRNWPRHLELVNWIPRPVINIIEMKCIRGIKNEVQFGASTQILSEFFFV